MRAMLLASRDGGVDFDRAWASAWDRIRWPHDTQHRVDWKEVLEEGRTEWRAAYDRTASLRRVYAAGALEVYVLA